MFDPKTNPGAALVELELDEGRVPRDAVYAAGFAMIDRCWVHLDRVDRAGAGRLKVALAAKSPGADLAALQRELEDEINAQAFRLQVVEANRALLDSVATKAFGHSAAPDAEPGSLDALLAGEEGAFEDPLGIAMSWEDKYGKKPEGAGGAS